MIPFANIPVEREGTTILGADPLLWALKREQPLFLYNTSLHFCCLDFLLATGMGVAWTTTHTHIPKSCLCTIVLSNPSSFTLVLLTSLLTYTCLLFRLPVKTKREANSICTRLDNDEYMDDGQHHHHHQAPPGAPSSTSEQNDVRESHVFPGYSGSYPPNPSVGSAAMAPSMHSSHGGAPHPSHPISARAHTNSHSKGTEEMAEEERISLFGDIPEAKKRKFILVDDPGKGGRVRVRVTLDTVDTDEIPDSFRKSNSVYPRSWFPIQMQSPPPSAHGSRFFEADEDDITETEGRNLGRGRGVKGKQMVTVPLADGGEAEIGVPRMRKSVRTKEVKLNDLGYRMTWHQSRVFADKTVFLQKACEFPL